MSDAEGSTDAVTSQPPKKELPPLTLKNVLTDVVVGIGKLFYDPAVSEVMSPIIMIVESILLKIIVSKVPYTDIDYATYCQQIELINDGERNYNNIKGDTGPIVYPAGYVYLYTFMNFVSTGIYDIEGGQWIFRWLYLGCLFLTLMVYLAAASGKIRPYTLYMISLSKRLHSIYVLRLFNDGFTTYFMLLTIVCLQYSAYFKKVFPAVSPSLVYIASVVFSMAISVKMNALLYLPGFLVVSYMICDENLLKLVFGPVLIALLTQVVIGYKFLGLTNFFSEESTEIRNAYLSNAFNFGRTFLYKWTVNWKFLDEETFSSDNFHKLLLALHLGTILIFTFSHWLTPKVTGKPISQFIKDGLKIATNTLQPQNILFNENESANYVMIVMSLSNLIGVLFSRSLHYQFLSWYSFTLPFLLYSSGLPFYVTIPMFGLHEVCWNIYPATAQSSATIVIILAVIVAANWVQKFDPKPLDKEEKKQN